jgi:hypothetical protein
LLELGYLYIWPLNTYKQWKFKKKF